MYRPDVLMLLGVPHCSLASRCLIGTTNTTDCAFIQPYLLITLAGYAMCCFDCICLRVHNR